ncbi:MAG: hypothetical protein JO247_05090 [Chloroflexi bacterium]|nr:hypothetical protein [Chloroflexota bacterium]
MAVGANGAGAACTLATNADVTAAYGETFDPGQASSPGGNSSCLFKQSGDGIDSVNITVFAGPAADSDYSADRTVYDATDVSGLGDTAFVSNDGGMIGSEQRGTTYTVHLVGFEKDTPQTLQAKQQAFVHEGGAEPRGLRPVTRGMSITSPELAFGAPKMRVCDRFDMDAQWPPMPFMTMPARDLGPQPRRPDEDRVVAVRPAHYPRGAVPP